MGMTETHGAAAKALGMTRDELHAAVQGGKSLADIAKDQKVSVDSLVKTMVAAAESELATDVKEGTITQAQANTMKSSLRSPTGSTGCDPLAARAAACAGRGGLRPPVIPQVPHRALPRARPDRGVPFAESPPHQCWSLGTLDAHPPVATDAVQPACLSHLFLVAHRTI